METQTMLNRQRKEILAQLADLGPMRKGSLSEQYVQSVLKDGSQSQRGPYTIYTFKENGKTISRRLNDQAQRDRFQAQIDAFRRFQTLTAELARIGQALADLDASGEADSKKNSRS
jgi:hypothetical protein